MMGKLTDIATFVQVVESGSFTAASERLGCSRSVVSKYITRLEERLGARLLNRTTRRLSLTEAGQSFFSRSQRGLQEIEAAETEVSRLQEMPRGKLRLNTPMSFGILHIAPALAGFLSRYPEISVDMRLDDRQVDLIEEGVDVAIRIAELPDSSLVARRLGPCRHVVCAAPEYLKRQGTPHTPDDLRRHNVITYQYQDSPGEWRFITPEGRYVSVPVRGSIQMNNSLAIREAVLSGAGITLTPAFVVGKDIKSGNLHEVLGAYRAQEISIYAVYPERRHLSPKVQAFINYMKKHLLKPVSL
jgi:DNA-binding transcriptional LysR family regulator